MNLFELLFIAVFVGSVGMLVFAGVAALLGRRSRSLAILRGVGVVAAIYLGILIVVSLVSPGRVLNVGDDQCWDDWCLTVTDVQRSTTNDGNRSVVTLRISSRARRIAQRGSNTHVYVMDSLGRKYESLPDPSEIPFDVLLQPQEAITTTRIVELPFDASAPALVATHGGGFPSWFIIGDPSSLFHRKTVVCLD